MSTRDTFNKAYAVQRNYGNPARVALELYTTERGLYRAAGFCAAQQEAVFIGWVNEDRWRTWLRLRASRWERKSLANH